MKTLNALDAKNRFGELSELVQREPVQILKRNRPAFVAVSVDDYRRMSELEHKVRKDAVEALRAAQTEVSRHELTEDEKNELLADFNLVKDD